MVRNWFKEWVGKHRAQMTDTERNTLRKFGSDVNDTFLSLAVQAAVEYVETQLVVEISERGKETVAKIAANVAQGELAHLCKRLENLEARASYPYFSTGYFLPTPPKLLDDKVTIRLSPEQIQYVYDAINSVVGEPSFAVDLRRALIGTGRPSLSRYNQFDGFIRHKKVS